VLRSVVNKKLIDWKLFIVVSSEKLMSIISKTQRMSAKLNNVSKCKHVSSNVSKFVSTCQ
jgi:hypothetical protein